MKISKISELPFVPEEYGLDVYANVDWSVIDSEMSDGQRRFVNGLIQYYEPHTILELGVSAGGGTVNLLNSMNNLENGGRRVLFSIDNAINFYRNPDLPVGYLAINKYANILEKSWHIITGKDPAEVMELINQKFDFCVIDTLHLHPIETLNFISVLPWLNDGAIVCMHDTTAFEWRSKPTFLHMFAPRLLLSSVCADKLIPNLPSGSMTVSNIAAWQVNPDTRKYCQNLFDVLYVPWETAITSATYNNIYKIVEKYYSPKMLQYLQEAVKVNKSFILAKKYETLSFEHDYGNLNEDTIFYGAGANLKELLTDLEITEIAFSCKVWDINAEKIDKINGYTVTKPDFSTPARPGQVMIITIENKQIANEVRKRFEPLGYTVFHGIRKYIISR